VDYLKVDMKPYPHSRAISWIKKDPSNKIIDQCHVPISIDKYYQDIITCDVVDMDTWGDHHIMMLTLPRKVKRTSICSIERAE